MKKESELRQATVMFADISGFTAMSEKMSPEEVTSIMNDCFDLIGDIVEHYEGRIDKFIGDCVMVTFGVPTAIENAPNKAINSAIEIRNKLYQFNQNKNLAIPLNIHIGINSGNVLAGSVGSRQKQEYTVMGDTVNLASRLEDTSQAGQVLVGSLTYQSTRDNFEYNELKPVKLKGKEKPVPVFELLSKKEKTFRRFTADRVIQSDLVGRDKEMDQLELAVLKAKSGEGSIVNVIGEAGIGKSRLIAELKNRETLKGVTILEGRAISIGRNLSFYPIIEILKSFAGIAEDDSESIQLKKLESAIKTIHPEQVDEVLPFTATLIGMKLTGKYAERVAEIEGEALEKLIFRNIRELIIKACELSPQMFIIEDLHWADNSSINMLQGLFNLVGKHGILFINVFRPLYEETGEKFLKYVKAEYPDHHSEMYLHRLNHQQSDLLIDNLLKIKGLSREMKEQIKQRSEGNPFFIEEVIRSFIDEGYVELKEHGFVITGKINSAVIPANIQELLMSRIDRLDEGSKSLLKTASVIGRNFFHKILMEVADQMEEVEDKLELLKNVQLIREGQSKEEVEYIFKHALAQETAYESILLKKRDELHLRTAKAIERLFQENLHEFYGMLAYHYSKGGNLDRAEDVMHNVDEIVDKGANLKSLNSVPTFKSWYLLSKFYYCLAILRKSLAAIDNQSSAKQKESARKTGKELIKTVRKVAISRVESYRLMGEYYWLVNKQKKALNWWDKTIKEGERLGARPDLARTYFEIGKSLLEPQSKYQHLNGIRAEAYLEKARVMFEEMDLQWDLEQLEKVKRQNLTT